MIKLVSLNIESHRHLHDRVLPFLQREQPDVICLQEVFEVDVPTIKEALGMEGQYRVMANVTETSIHQQDALGQWGLLQLSRLPINDQQAGYYVGDENQVPEFYFKENPNSMNRIFLWMTVTSEDGHHFTIGTTHFTWSTKGESTPEQHRDLDALFEILDDIPEIVFAGDFNAPRGGETFARLAAKYRDNIPPEVTTSLDGQFHKAGQLELMVDGLFSTPEYEITNVQVVGGLSDHKAIVATVARL